MRKRVILLGDERKPGVREAVERVRKAIEGTAELVAVDLDFSLELTDLEADLVVIFGGDGSILASARRMGRRPIPTIGVNFGKFGFLTDIRARDVVEDITRVLAGEAVVERRLLLNAKIARPEGDQALTALNEFFLGPLTVGRVVTIEVHLDGEYATTYRGDGVLVATPTGSTGHSLSAGGPILDPELEAIILTPVNPHSLSNRPLVLPPDVEVRLRPEPDHSDPVASLSADGQVSVEIRAGEEVAIRRATHRFPLVKTGARGRYDVLRERLGWSGLPPYRDDE
ncbi:MAG: NAD(+)/NADH kinase [Planctomycetota bacterium]